MITTSEDYHQIFESWGLDVARSLRETLKRKKVSRSVSEEIIGDFLFGLAMQFDHGGFYKVQGEFKPKMSFQNLLGELVVPAERTHLHEYAHAIAAMAFDEIIE